MTSLNGHGEDEGGQVIALRPDSGADAQDSGQPPGPPIPPAVAAGDGEPGKRRPIVPPALGRDRWRQTAGEWAGETCYRCAYHAVRSPWYPVWFSFLAGRGGWRLVKKLARWWSAPELKILESEAVARGNAAHHQAMQAHLEGTRTRKRHGQIVGVSAFLAAGVIAAALKFAPWWAWPLAGCATYPVLVYHGRPIGKPIIHSAIVPPQYQPPTKEIITQAFDSLGIGRLSAHIKTAGTLDWIIDLHNDNDGWAIELDLPKGVTAKMIIAKRKELSSGLRRPLSAVWPEAVPGEHEGRLFLWIGRRDLAKQKPVPYPLLKSGTGDIFQQAPFGTLPRGTKVTVPMFQANWLVGATMGNGKTATLRVLLAWAALDTVCDLWIHEHSGKGDLEPYAQVSHRYVSGIDDESIAYTAESLRMLRRELEKRQKIFKTIPGERKPDAALTRELALADRRLRPIAAVFDEAHNAFSHPRYGEQIEADMEFVMRLGRAYGIMIFLATQRPGQGSIPPAITAVLVIRFCLKVNDQVTNDMILGTGSYTAGWNAAEFRHEIDAGLGWLRGAAEPCAPKVYYLNLPATKKVAARARAMREAAGVLSGHALGEENPAEETRDYLADVLSVFGTEPNLWCKTIAERMRDRIPGVYADTTPAAVSSQLKARGVTVKNVREPGRDPNLGCERAAVEAALAGKVPAAAPAEGQRADPELLALAAEQVISTQHATTAMLQRKLRVTHAEALDLMAALELAGIVGTAREGSVSRDVLVKPDGLGDALARVKETAGV